MLENVVGKATFCDVFCEETYFTRDQTKLIIKKAKSLGFKTRIHADEFVDSGAAKVAALLNVASADHLMAISDANIERLAKKKNIIATILPGTTVFLGKNQFAPARKMIDSGSKVAIGSDFNPGSCHFQSQPLMMNFAMQNCKMTLEEAFRGVTRNAALSLKLKNEGLI
jgi:imidazolonepropionase